MKKTKTTYLINKVHADGSVRLSVVSSTECSAVARRNKEIPADQRRYFIVDYIAERDRIDRMVIETTFEAYSEWNREHARTERNRKLAKSFRFYSLEDVITRENGGGYPEMDNKAEYSVEDQIFDRILIWDLRDRLAAWRPWANELLDLYLAYQKHICGKMAEKYGVSAQTMCKYKRQFEEFIKNFLSGVSTEGPFCVEE